ncbi:MAG: imidazole glycerol phosphate synthase subunit HisH [Vicinamibacteria bacterium]|nr:imidazole glycerol phosphate synthase subunit HisH [Vicinamibacteria bacterium]
MVLLDSGGANLGSVQAAFARLGVEAPVTTAPATIAQATHVVLPGVGTAAACMARLRENGLDQLIPRLTQPLLGICVGMQLLFERSQESDTECLGLLAGEVRRLTPSPGIRIPHMGWNRLNATAAPPHPLVAGLDEASVYFVHSYAAAPSPDTIASCVHGEPFAAVVARGLVMGAQFHPERSSVAGARLLRNFLEIS